MCLCELFFFLRTALHRVLHVRTDSSPALLSSNLGARLEAMYPVSNPFDGQALNITCTSYINTLNFGFTGCRDSLPHMQHLAIYMGDALIELEAAYGLSGDETSPADRKSTRLNSSH